MRRWVQSAPLALSAALHALLVGYAPASPRPGRLGEVVEIQVTSSRPSPPAPHPEPAPAPRPPRHRIALAPTREVPLPRAPPPPSASPAPQAPRGPVRIGISISSTTESGAAAAPTGNTLYGRAPEQAPDPSFVKPYRADRYANASEVTTLPEPISTKVPRSEYPAEARRIGFEGVVRLRFLVDEEGRVRRAVVVVDPGHGLGQAAARVAERYFRFRPARRAGEPVATEIPFAVHFELS